MARFSMLQDRPNAHGAARRATKMQIDPFSVLVYMFLVLILCILIAPLAWLVILSLRPAGQVYQGSLLPDSFDIGNYARVFQKVALLNYIRNSVILGLGTILVTLPIGSLAGYAFARWRFRGKNVVFFLFIFALTIPGLVNLIAIYRLVGALGWLNTYHGLIFVYSGASLPVTTWLMRAYFQTIPTELDEAALIDGCSQFGAFVRVVLPISTPGLSAAALLVFVTVWHEFIVAQTLVSKSSMRVVSQGLFAMQQQYVTDYTALAATAIIISVPVVVLFIVLQDRFIAGLTAGAVK